MVRLTYSVANTIAIVGSFGLISQIECFKLYFFVVPWAKPGDHGVVVSFSGDVLVGPLLFN